MPPTKCTLCPLHVNSLVNCLSGEGPSSAKIMFIGEAPGEMEEKAQRPFVGPAGQIFDRLLAQADINRQDIFVTNTCRCRPVKDILTRKGNRTPIPEEVNACSPYLEEEIQRIKPTLIVTAGNIASQRILGNKIGTITKIRGQEMWSDKYGCKVIPIIHPSALLYESKFTSTTLTDLKFIKASSQSLTMVQPKETHYQVTQTWEDILRLLEQLQYTVTGAGLAEQELSIAIDVETSGLDWLRDKLVSIAFCWFETFAGAIQWRDANLEYVWNQEQRELIINKLQRYIFQNPKVTKYGHNLKFDEHMIRTAGMGTICFPKYDTILMHHLTDTEAPHGLKELAKVFTDMGNYDKELDEIFYRTKVVDRLYHKIPWPILGKYNCADVDCTIRIKNSLWIRIRELKLEKTLTDLTMAIHQLMLEAEEEGVPVDLELIYKLIDTKQIRLKEIESGFNQLAGKEVNLRSSKQLNNLFFNVLKWQPLAGTQTKTGFSLNEEVLEQYAKQYSYAELLVEHRGICKDISTYLKGTRRAALLGRSTTYPEATKKEAEKHLLNEHAESVTQLKKEIKEEIEAAKQEEAPDRVILELEEQLEDLSSTTVSTDSLKKARVNQQIFKTYETITSFNQARELGFITDGKVHADFKVFGTATGRISCKDPNLQNIKKGSNMHNMFVAAPGCVFLEADYRQAEVRVLAVYSGDSQLIADLVNGIDIHAVVAADRFGIPIEQVTKEQRAIAKTVVFGVAYGRQAKSIADQFNIPEFEAQAFINKFFAKYPHAYLWQELTKKFALEHKYVTSLFGRVRWLPNIDSPDAKARNHSENEALNTPVQSVASDITFLAIIRIMKRIKELGLKTKFLIPVHDSALFMIPRTELSIVVPIIKEELERKIIHPTVPFDIDITISERWKGEPLEVAA